MQPTALYVTPSKGADVTGAAARANGGEDQASLPLTLTHVARPTAHNLPQVASHATGDLISLTGDVFDETIDCVALLEPRWGALARYRTSHSRSHSLQPLLLTPLTSSLLLFLKLALFSQKTNLASTNCVALLDGPRALALAVRHLDPRCSSS